MATIRAKSSHIMLVLRRGWVSRTARITAGSLAVGKEGVASGLDRQETRSDNQSAIALVQHLSWQDDV